MGAFLSRRLHATVVCGYDKEARDKDKKEMRQ